MALHQIEHGIDFARIGKHFAVFGHAFFGFNLHGTPPHRQTNSPNAITVCSDGMTVGLFGMEIGIMKMGIRPSENDGRNSA
ncbi:hypothetical protein C7N83_02740 [Neisseria iguanae]|uniref:Uncharacterized protein n=1 Tax=Neisseria iguanae TaxID=90242 RepID=A0A2P7U252_9NEIS|nr:hypothetical protein C7N83_02740 [Neisseria iguanae]